MEFLNIVVLAVVQGITEFLPISSSAHLILVPQLTGWADQGLAIDVATHVGTLVAVILYFHVEVRRMLAGAWTLMRRGLDSDARLLLQLVVATLPVVVAGFLLKDIIADEFRSPMLIAATTIGFGVLLYLADRGGDRLEGGIDGMRWRDAILIGLAQTLALVPGVSRSGITMTAALFLAFRRTEAARFSLLLSMPTTFAAGALGGYEILQSGDTALQSDALLAAILAFAAALAAIAGMMRWLSHSSFTPFVLYRLVLGVFLIVWFI